MKHESIGDSPLRAKLQVKICIVQSRISFGKCVTMVIIGLMLLSTWMHGRCALADQVRRWGNEDSITYTQAICSPIMGSQG